MLGGCGSIYKADESKMKLARFHQIPETNTYLHVSASQPSYNAMLIAKVDWAMPVSGAPLSQNRHLEIFLTFLRIMIVRK